MKRRLITAIKFAVPNLTKMIVEDKGITFYLDDNLIGIKEFQIGTLEWRASKVAEHLPVGEYCL